MLSVALYNNKKGKNRCLMILNGLFLLDGMLLFFIVLEDLRARVGRPKLVQAPSSFIAGHHKAALLFRFFGGFRCGVPLFIVILVK